MEPADGIHFAMGKGIIIIT